MLWLSIKLYMGLLIVINYKNKSISSEREIPSGRFTVSADEALVENIIT